VGPSKIWSIPGPLTHSSVAVVLDRYGHLFPGIEHTVNDRLEQMAREGHPEASGYRQVVELRR
jgi:hypothetical protein